jgi:hypothetical protein
MGLTRSVTDRVFVGLMGAVFAPLSGFVLYAQLTRPEPTVPDDWFVRVFFFLIFEGVCVVFVGCVLGIIWAIWTPDWIERKLRHCRPLCRVALRHQPASLSGRIALRFRLPPVIRARDFSRAPGFSCG